ncbi:MAG: hypothetical protein AAGI52_12670 [Bacteroidota bacterium]
MHPKLSHARLTIPIFAGLALALAACQDPSGVGLTLIGDETSDPNARLVAADSLFPAERIELTGGFADGSGSPVQTRLLLGAFTDTILGDTRATAYLDAREQAGSTAFDERDVERVQIELVRAEAIGDTLAMVPVEIREVTANWNPEGLPSDTTLATGDVLVSEMFSATDSLVTLTLPDAYVAANQATFRDSLDIFFEGFQLSVPQGATPGAVVGFNAPASHLVLIGEEYEDDGETTRDTVRYDLVEVYTALDRGAPSEIADRFLLRDGTPEFFGLQFGLDEVQDLPLANAGLRIPIDRSVNDLNDGFHRPLLPRLSLFAVLGDEDETRVLILERDLSEVDDEILLRNRDLTSLLQAALLGDQSISRFELGPPSSPLGLGVLPILIEDEPVPSPDTPRRPRLSLITVGSPA